MRIIHHAALILLMAALPTLAHAQWYVGMDGGVNILEDAKISDASGNSATVGSKTGYVLQMQGGYDFGGPKVEFEIGYRNSGLKSVADTSEVGGHSSSLSFMTNGLYEFLPKSSWHPFVGAGIGMARVSARWEENGSNMVEDSDWQFAYQAMAGVGYDLTRNWGVKAQYRYFATLDPEFTTSGGNTISAENHNHAFLLGLTYTFGATKADTAQAAPAVHTAMGGAPLQPWSSQLRRAN